MMTCLKITESQNGQIYPEDTFSHGPAHLYMVTLQTDWIQIRVDNLHRSSADNSL